MKSKLVLELIAHQNELKRKKLTKAGKERKDRIAQKVIVDENKICLYMSIYCGVAGNEKIRKNPSTGRT